MTNVAYLNGEFMPHELARISIDDRGFLYGDGLFDTMRAYGGVPFRVEEHLRRILTSADTMKIRAAESPEDLKRAVYALLERNDLKDARVRLTITRGVHAGDLSFETDGRPTVVVTAAKLTPPPPRDYEKGIAVRLVREMSNPPSLAGHKTTSYLPYLMARDAAVRQGAREAIIVNKEGVVLEASTAAVFAISRGAIFTPKPELGLLPGIAGQTISDVAEEAGMALRNESFKGGFLLGADEVFIANSIIEIMPVSEIDGQKAGKGEHTITRRVHGGYKKLVAAYVKSRGGTV